jgi:hypothetical protein
MILPVQFLVTMSEIDHAAHIVWCGALTGRKFARSDDPDTRLRAYERMRHLERIENERFPSLTRIAQSAARDINSLLAIHEKKEIVQ